MTGPTRSISITTIKTKATFIYMRRSVPSIVIDGVPQPAQWGTGVWDVPRDQPVTVQIASHQGAMRFGPAEYVIEPGGPTALVYRAPWRLDRPGRLEPAGTV